MAQDEEPNGRLPEFLEGDAESPEQGLSAPTSVNTRLVIPGNLLAETLAELDLRSAGRRESAALLCGRVVNTDWIAEQVRFHHLLCNDRGRALSMSLTENAKFTLYEELSRLGLRLVAAVHTHPHDWVELSKIDQRNQICSRMGFWSIVVPWYGRHPWELSNMGVHILTADGWKRLTIDQIRSNVQIEEMPWNHMSTE
jgi:proteasome lid subunit RPN8/RPN11